MRRILGISNKIAILGVLVVAGCGDGATVDTVEAPASSGIAEAPMLTEPTVVAQLDGPFSNWANFETRFDVPVLIYRLSYCEPPEAFGMSPPWCETAIVDEAGHRVDVEEYDFDGERVLPLFEFDPIELPDGRLLVRTRSMADDAIEGWSQRNPDSVSPGGPVPPIVASKQSPLRLFVYDPDEETLTAVSHWPESRTFTTAISRSLQPDQILHTLILGGGRTVAYTVGFSGAGYDVPYALYLAPIPARAAGRAAAPSSEQFTTVVPTAPPPPTTAHTTTLGP
jgi:hypothetical protein